MDTRYHRAQILRKNIKIDKKVVKEFKRLEDRAGEVVTGSKYTLDPPLSNRRFRSLITVK